MSKARYIWWGYVKAMIRAYTKDATEKEGETSKKERAAVSAALEDTKMLGDGSDRLTLIDMVFFSKTHTLDGAAQQIPCSYRTARRWHKDFILIKKKKYGLLP